MLLYKQRATRTLAVLIYEETKKQNKNENEIITLAFFFFLYQPLIILNRYEIIENNQCKKPNINHTLGKQRRIMFVH